MSKFGDFKFEDWRRFHKDLRLLQKRFPELIEECLQELAEKLFAKSVARTPVQAGELRRKWSVGKIKRTGNSYQIEVFNTAENAMSIEFGYRSPNNSGWVQGKFMLTISEKELQQELPNFLDRKLQQFMKKI